MIIQVIDDVRVAVLEAENDAPVGVDRDGPKARAIAFERMQTQARCIDFLDPSRLIEQCQGEFGHGALVPLANSAVINRPLSSWYSHLNRV